MKPLVKKITIISLTLALVIGCFCITSSAQPINGNDEVSNLELLMIPRRTSYFQFEKIDEGYYGVTFATNPLYRPTLRENQAQITYVNCTPAGNFTGASYMTHLTQRIDYTYTGAYYYRYTSMLSHASQSQEQHVYIGQFDYENIRIRHGVDPNTWIYYARNHARPNVSIRVVFLKWTEGEGWADGEALTSIDFNHTDRFDIRDIYDLCVANGAYTGDERGILVRQLTITNLTYDGSLMTMQDEESVGGSIKQALLPELIASPQEDFPLLLEWLSISIGAFFDTTIFAMGNVNVKIGTLFIIPLACWVVVAFLKKFAGG